ncbi:hypothetical protein [Rhizobium sp. F40D2]|uniref:hypothetical protein n=1 Tax=Rhizobium sp. F40D2 TaxID=3453141 RepID=UPI003F1FA4D7
MKVTNNSKAPQGLHTVIGVRFVRPGETKELDLTEGQAKRISRLGFIDLEGDPVEDRAPSFAFTEADDKEGVYVPSAEFNAMRSAFEQLRAENADLRKQLDGRSPAADGPKGPFEVKETSPGWHGVFGADGKQIGKNMRADDAEAFKAMTPAEQEQLLAQ